MNLTDKEIIEHVSKKSKHPHAAMIVEWLLTGKEVMCFGSIVEYPAWYPNDEYEFKPQKPAYRVYRDGDLTSTVDRLDDGTLTDDRDNFDWLTDWIEYDPVKSIKTYEGFGSVNTKIRRFKPYPSELVERISKINLGAAEWLRDNWDELLDEKYSRYVSVGRYSTKLHSMFYWKPSPQGNDYWESIATQLGE